MENFYAQPITSLNLDDDGTIKIYIVYNSTLINLVEYITETTTLNLFRYV